MLLKTKLAQLFRDFIHLDVPCYGCGLEVPPGKFLCTPCAHLVPPVDSVCKRCARPSYEWFDSETCLSCHERPPAYDVLRAATLYQSPVKDWLGRFKYASELSLQALLQDLLRAPVKAWLHQSPGLEGLIPMPLHPKRLRKRGFNQAYELIKGLDTNTVPVYTDRCWRSKNTPPQASLSTAERLSNCRDAFTVAKPWSLEHVVIFDDVVTTGATVEALARCLKLHGAQWVEVWCLARA